MELRTQGSQVMAAADGMFLLEPLTHPTVPSMEGLGCELVLELDLGNPGEPRSVTKRQVR